MAPWLAPALFLAVASCGASPAVATQTPEPSPPPSATASRPTAPATEPSPPPEPPEAAAATFLFAAPRSVAWVVTRDGCTGLTIRASSETEGTLGLRGVQVMYAHDADQLSLSQISRLQGDGIVIRRCATRLRLGPGLTMGGAELFEDEEACKRSQDATTPLDDSRATVAAACDDPDAAVSTDNVDCDATAQPAGPPGCITAALIGLGD